MIKIPRTIWVIGILAVVVMVVLASLPAHQWNDEYAPVSLIHCSIKAVGSAEEYEGTVDVGDESLLQALTASNPMTAFTSDVDGIDANTDYVISFAVTVSAKSAKPGEALMTYVNVTGKNGGGSSYIAQGPNDITPTETIRASGSQTAGSTVSFPTIAYDMYSHVGTFYTISGDVIDGSTFTFDITATAADGRKSTTSATLDIVVTSGGTIYLSVDNITTSVDSPEGMG